MRKKGDEDQFRKFIEMLKNISVTIPFTEVLDTMPSYVKFMKDMISKKRKVSKEVIPLTENCCVVINKTFPEKRADPGSFMIPCSIGLSQDNKALCDLGSSINLMPLHIYNKIGLKEMQPTGMSLQMADRSCKTPLGIV